MKTIKNILTAPWYFKRIFINKYIHRSMKIFKHYSPPFLSVFITLSSSLLLLLTRNYSCSPSHYSPFLSQTHSLFFSLKPFFFFSTSPSSVISHCSFIYIYIYIYINLRSHTIFSPTSLSLSLSLARAYTIFLFFFFFSFTPLSRTYKHYSSLSFSHFNSPLSLLLFRLYRPLVIPATISPS